MKQFDNWLDARTYAIARAKETHHDQAIRKLHHPIGDFIVSFAHDTDYIKAEIVTPKDMI